MKQLLFTDETESQLSFYLNDKGKIFLICGSDIFDKSNFDYSGCIVLDREDVKDIIKELNRLVKIMPNE